jgi:hypothetical protein
MSADHHLVNVAAASPLKGAVFQSNSIHPMHSIPPNIANFRQKEAIQNHNFRFEVEFTYFPQHWIVSHRIAQLQLRKKKSHTNPHARLHLSQLCVIHFDGGLFGERNLARAASQLSESKCEDVGRRGSRLCAVGKGAKTRISSRRQTVGRMGSNARMRREGRMMECRAGVNYSTNEGVFTWRLRGGDGGEM